MSLFKALYEQSVVKSRESIDCKVPTYNIYPNNSEACLASLFYIHNYGFINAKYPYDLTLSKLNCYLIIYTLTGQGCLKYCNQKHLIPADSVVFLDCTSGFHIELANSSSWNFHWFYLNSNNLYYYYDQYYSDQLPVLLLENATGTKSALTKLCDYMIQDKHNEMICSMLIDSMLTNLVIDKKQANEQVPRPTYITSLQTLLDQKYYESFTLEQLSRQFNVCKYTLSRDFTRYVGTSPIEYLITRRIKKSKQLLISTDLSINEIALNVGINNPTHFINLFRKRVGITPLQYRKQTTCEMEFIHNT